MLYDRYHKKQVLRKWSNSVSHLAKETLPNNVMPRRITILLSAPPGDGLRPAREHFHEYVKPILVAGAIDWEVIEGRREGEVRAGLAENIRKKRRRSGEKFLGSSDDEDESDMVAELRQRVGTEMWKGVQGDLILGRHTWKEYVRGLHEGWLGPLKDPSIAGLPVSPETPAELGDVSLSDPTAPTDVPISQEGSPADSSSSEKEAEKPPDKATKSSPTPPYLVPSAYATTSTISDIPPTLGPSIALPLPHLLGIIHTPTRLYRFLTRRHLADSTGASVAALVLATYSRPYSQSTSFALAADPDAEDASPSSSTLPAEGIAIPTGQSWEQESMLRDEEAEWHKSARAAPKAGEEDNERVWTEPMVIDSRIGERMRVFELEQGVQKRASEEYEEARKKEPSLFAQAKEWVGWRPKTKAGWEMGLEGDEDS